MDLFDVARACLRRWYIVLPLLAIAAWYSHHVYNSVKPEYYSNAVISMSPPSSRVDVRLDGSPVPRNGLLDVGGAGLVSNLTALGLRDPAVVAQVVAAGGQPNYVARIFPVPTNSPQLPMILIEATEPDPAAAKKTVELVVAQADPTLLALQQQAGVPDEQLLKPFTVSPPSAPVAGMPSRARSTVAVFAAGAGIAIVVAVVIDVLFMRWKARRQKRRETPVRAVDGADLAHEAALPHAHEAAPAHEPAPVLRTALPPRSAPPHAVDPALGVDAPHAVDPAFGVDPTEAYSRNKHAAADEVWTDSR